jgi:asparagine synthase (glutamine-hydrolysing)
MFAFAVRDAADRSLLLARDRFRIKPLYSRLAASDRVCVRLGALRAAHLAGGDIAGRRSAFLRWTVCAMLTWQRGVDMIAPGTWQHGGSTAPPATAFMASSPTRGRRTPARGAVTLRHSGPTSARPFATACAPPRRRRACRRISVGQYRLGRHGLGVLPGIDKPADLHRRLRPRLVETERAREVATLLARRMRTVTGRKLPAISPRARAPRSTDDRRGQFVYVARAVAATGIKAVLSGAGGDELFGGYASFTRLPRAMAIKRLTGPLWPALGALAEPLMPERLRARWRHFASSNGSFIEAYRVQRGFLLPEEVQAIAGPALRDDARWREAVEIVRDTEHTLMAPMPSSSGERPQATVARLESRMYLASQLLRDLDVMSMAHALEVRVPFVDHELLEEVWPELACHPRSSAREAAAVRHARTSAAGFRPPSSKRDSPCLSRNG